MEKTEAGSGDGFIDRSKVRILLCDNDRNSSEEVFDLLCKCSYQVISVRSPRQVIDALNAEGADIDIILSEVDLPMCKGLKMLKYIMKDKDLQRIPVIMMSAQDEVSIVVKCLKFGAADYLVKPLRTNELLNLWTHMWRRRRMLGFAEKSIVMYDLDLVASDPSDANTKSTTLFSDDTDDKSQKSNNLDICVSTHQEDTAHATAATTPVEAIMLVSLECQPDVPGISDRRTGQISAFQKNELKIGESSSAFFTYVKSNIHQDNQVPVSIHENPHPELKIVENLSTIDLETDAQEHDLEIHSCADGNSRSASTHDSILVERSRLPPIPLDKPQQKSSNEQFSDVHANVRNDSPSHTTGCYTYAAGPYFLPGLTNQASMSPASVYHNYLPDIHNKANSVVLHQYNPIPQCPPHMPGTSSYPCFPFGICLQPGQMPAPHPWPSVGNSSGREVNSSKIDRREAALIKFRQKRKERCFDKKIRYINRKKLAERRPRLRGQFIRKMNGITVDLNGQPASAEEDEEEEDDEEEEEENV